MKPIHLLIPVCLLLAACSPKNTDANASAATNSAPAAPSASASGLATVSGKASRGAVVTLESVTPQNFPPPPGPALLDQYGRAFVPDVLLVRVGQPVNFRNSEDTPHNVRVDRSRTGTLVFNDTRPPFETYTHTFDQPGQYEVICDIHPGMCATLVVTASPFAAVIDDSGAFTFTDVPPGEYVLAVTMGGRTTSKQVRIAAPRTELAP